MSDNIIFLFGTIFTIISIYILDIEVLKVDNKAIALFFILTFFGADFIAFCYVIGFLFKNPDSAFKYSIIVTLVLGVVPYTIVFALE